VAGAGYKFALMMASETRKAVVKRMRHQSIDYTNSIFTATTKQSKQSQRYASKERTRQTTKLTDMSQFDQDYSILMPSFPLSTRNRENDTVYLYHGKQSDLSHHEPNLQLHHQELQDYVSSYPENHNEKHKRRIVPRSIQTVEEVDSPNESPVLPAFM
jgi:hypothetical protein